MNPSLLLSLLMSLSTPTDTNVKNPLNCVAPCLMGIKAPIVIEVNEFTEDSAKAFASQMSDAQQTGQTIIPIVIDSYGGSVMALMRMVSIVQSSKIPVATIVEGKAMSCGAVLFMMGKEGYRFAGSQATILIHEVSSADSGKLHDLKVSVAETEALNSMIFSLMNKNTGHPLGFFEKILKDRLDSDWFIPVDQAKKLNIVNHIGLPEFKTKVDVKYILE